MIATVDDLERIAADDQCRCAGAEGLAARTVRREGAGAEIRQACARHRKGPRVGDRARITMPADRLHLRSRAAFRTASRATASPSKTLMRGCAIPAIRRSRDAEVLGYLNAENAYFESGDGAASRADRHHLRRDERPREGRRFQRAAEGRRLPSTGMPSMPAADYREMVPAAGRRRRRCRDPRTSRNSRKATIISGSAAPPSARMRACSPMPPTPTAPSASC